MCVIYLVLIRYLVHFYQLNVYWLERKNNEEKAKESRKIERVEKSTRPESQ